MFSLLTETSRHRASSANNPQNDVPLDVPLLVYRPLGSKDFSPVLSRILRLVYLNLRYEIANYFIYFRDKIRRIQQSAPLARLIGLNYYGTVDQDTSYPYFPHLESLIPYRTNYSTRSLVPGTDSYIKILKA